MGDFPWFVLAVPVRYRGGMRYTTILTAACAALLVSACDNDPAPTPTAPAAGQQVPADKEQLVLDNWQHREDRSEEQLRADHEECKMEGQATGGPPMGRLGFYMVCMQERGWKLAPGD